MGLVEPDASCVPYARRPEWCDLEPLPPPQGDAGKVVAIQYSERHSELLSYFRAILAKGEKSPRALELTRHLISFNSADYTAWQWRWQCVAELSADLEEERQLTERVAAESAKNYQLWNHRRKIAARLGPGAAAEELAFAGRFLDVDEKNYHAWAHRQAVVAASGCYAEELRYSEAMIERDVQNNSAWAQRAFCKLALLNERLRQDGQQQQQQQQRPLDGASLPAVDRRLFLELLPAELEYAAVQLAVAPRNESAWNYLTGLFTFPGATPHEMGRHRDVFIICEEALLDCPSCAPALEVMAQYLMDMACLLRAVAQQQQQQQQQQQGEAAAAAPSSAAARAKDAATKALQVLDKAATADPMRRSFLCHKRDEALRLVAELDGLLGG